MSRCCKPLASISRYSTCMFICTPTTDAAKRTLRLVAAADLDRLRSLGGGGGVRFGSDQGCRLAGWDEAATRELEKISGRKREGKQQRKNKLGN